MGKMAAFQLVSYDSYIALTILTDFRVLKVQLSRHPVEGRLRRTVRVYGVLELRPSGDATNVRRDRCKFRRFARTQERVSRLEQDKRTVRIDLKSDDTRD